MKASCAYPELLDIALLDGLPLQVRSDFLDRCKLRYCSEQTTILTQSEHTSGLFIIARGRVAVTYLGPDGHMSVIHVAMTGEVLGDTEALAAAPCAATCTTLPDTTLLYCPTSHLVELAQSPVVLRNLARILLERLRRDNHYRVLERFQSIEERLCSYLRQFSTPQDPLIRMSQTQLATLLGCSRQKVNRMLNLLQDSGVVDLGRSRIRVLDRDELERREYERRERDLTEPRRAG
ncbi:MAG: Crp/Fnr family transcriptional regulator [Rhodobacteraceae bacterium]|nr:Crp/Fnr family transcriptional regulator [Paracoccaceae bacterium]